MEEPPVRIVSVSERPHRIATNEINVTNARMPPMERLRVLENKQTNILSDALVRVIGPTGNELPPIVGTLGQSRAQVAIR
jgi:hypothetical protein